MIRVDRIAYAAFETPDLAAQTDHYERVMGLKLVERDTDTAYLTAGVDHHTVILRRGDAGRCVALGFQVPPGTDLGDYATQIGKHGIATARRSDSQPNIRDLVAFEDNKGTRIEVFAEHEPVPNGPRWSGIAPNKLGHVAFNVTDIQATVKFYCDVLGFRASDWMGDFFAFLRCGPDHHSINLVTGATTKMHHIAFELRDWTHIRDACDFLAQERTPLVWGPVRHGIGHNISTYHRNPDGQIIELFCELDRVNESTQSFEPRRVHQDFPQSPKVWSDILQAANMWGSPPPEGFLD
ncbi:VOC family protein [Microvirga sp. BT350]|uniref:VOC family protein n=2 Tax=Microvirga alba TaxID=2791025 RepID=A0A931FPC4_9HYPH|nr:VOC family protein [Microvirga alba]